MKTAFSKLLSKSANVDVGGLSKLKRPLYEFESLYCRRVDNYEFSPDHNMGIMIDDGFVSWRNKKNDTRKIVINETEVLEELSEIKKSYAYPYGQKEKVMTLSRSSALMDSSLKVGKQRISGRKHDDADACILAPWGHGSNIQTSLLPRSLQQMVKSIASSGFYDVSEASLRHACVEFSNDYMFKQDLLTFPAEDGEKVFIITLASDAVVTLSPDQTLYSRMILEHPETYREPIRTVPLPDSIRPIRTSQEHISVYSWTDADIDLRLVRGSLLCLHGDARYQWKHGIRNGVEGLEEPQIGICDWIASMNVLSKRNESKVSIILGFDASNQSNKAAKV